jgi:hypothetical protein
LLPHQHQVRRLTRQAPSIASQCIDGPADLPVRNRAIPGFMKSPPDWLVEMANQVAQAIEGFELLAPIGSHVWFNEMLDQWELSVFPSATEVLGGRFDGKRNDSRFSLDIALVLGAFDTVSQVRWQSHRLGEDDELGQHISVEGTVKDNLVWLRVLATPPERFEPGRRYNEADQRLEELW